MLQRYFYSCILKSASSSTFKTITMAKSDVSSSKSTNNSLFVQTLNPMTGHKEWKVVPDDYDYQQELARAAFADMLHDHERNHLYFLGLKAAIEQKRAEGKAVNVLDIGTGTGLLAMMAAKLGADSVVAIEEFPPMANCAEKIISVNGFKDKIKLIRNRSTEVKTDQDNPTKCNILVTEVFDTELIGEGAISTFNMAHKNLLSDDCLVVPCEGVMYAQVVECQLADHWNRLAPMTLGENPEDVIEFGSSDESISLSLHDLQLSQIKQSWFKPITSPLEIFRFNFGSQQEKGPIPKRDQSVVKTRVLNGGICHAIFMWWDIYMDPKKEIVLSCAPYWAHPDPENMPWRDHWMQSVYYPKEIQEVSPGSVLTLISNHDEYSFWFNLKLGEHPITEILDMPKPGYGIHLAVSRQRLGQINHPERNSMFYKAFTSAIDKFVETTEKLPVCLCLSECSLVPLIFAHYLGKISDSVKFSSTRGRIYVSEQNGHMREVLQNAIQENTSLQKIEFIFLKCDVVDLNHEGIQEKVDIIFGEPHFSVSYLPWHNLLFWYSLQGFWHSDLMILPQKATLWVMPVHYENLWKIRAPVKNVEGFDMEHFDNIIMAACDKADANIEPHPLWEYPCQALAEPLELMDFDLTMRMPEENVFVRKDLMISNFEKDLNGLAFWVTWNLSENPNCVIGGGPKEYKVGETVVWDVHSKQGVHFFQKPTKNTKSVTLNITFGVLEGDLQFKIDRNVDEGAN